MKLLKILYSSAAACFVGTSGYCYFSGNPWFYSYILMPSTLCVDPERSHRIAIFLAAKKIVPKDCSKDEDILGTSVWGKTFTNPIGLAAGFDKHAEALDGMLNMGFGFVEVGSITPLPQIGNPKPRVFRLKQDGAVINRYGFNSHGHRVVKSRLSEWREKQAKKIINYKYVGVNLGKNKNTVDAVGDYVEGVKCLGSFADYIVVNVSSPNTPGLRDMQGKKQLSQLLEKVLEECKKLPKKPPLLIKIAPDLTREDMEDIASVVTKGKGCGADGIVVCNTTVQRPNSLQCMQKAEKGGLSGKPLKDIGTDVISEMYTLTEGKLPIIGVGGVFTGRDAYEKIIAGASLVQIYTSLSYEGPPVVRKIKNELADILRKEGYSCLSEAVGAAHRKS